jgi:hypothetical protein
VNLRIHSNWGGDVTPQGEAPAHVSDFIMTNGAFEVIQTAPKGTDKEKIMKEKVVVNGCFGPEEHVTKVLEQESRTASAFGDNKKKAADEMTFDEALLAAINDEDDDDSD